MKGKKSILRPTTKPWDPKHIYPRHMRVFGTLDAVCDNAKSADLLTIYWEYVTCQACVERKPK